MTHKIKALFVQVVRNDRYEVTEIKIEPYEKGTHLATARKFLLLSTVQSDTAEDLLVIGGRDPETEYHKDLRETFVRNSGFCSWQTSLLGAGNIGEDQVTSWESRGYEIYTPEKYQQPILEALSLA